MEVVVKESMALDDTELYICIIVKVEPYSVVWKLLSLLPSYVVSFMFHLDNFPSQSPTRESLLLKTGVFELTFLCVFEVALLVFCCSSLR